MSFKLNKKNYAAISFDIGYTFKKEKYAFELFIQNPLNAAYIKNDLEKLNSNMQLGQLNSNS